MVIPETARKDNASIVDQAAIDNVAATTSFFLQS